MPGITGIFTKTTTGNERALLRDMVGVMLHEPFYTHGSYSNDDLGFHVGYVSIEGSFSDCMPIWNESATLVMFLTGESYVDQDVLDGLGHRGHKFDAHNGSFLLHMYEEDQERFWTALNGWISGVIIGMETRQAILFNDRCGMRRLYCHETPTGLFFSSEAKSLLKILPHVREIDPRSVGEYLVYDCVLENRTYFRGVNLLPPGTHWTWSNGTGRRRTYFDATWHPEQPPIAEAAFVDEFAVTFRHILPRYLRGTSIGLSLTGGLDTRTILACMNPKPGELPCYTFGGTYREMLDVRLARRVAKAAAQPHHVLCIDDAEFLAEYPSHLERSIYITDGVEPVDNVDMIPFCRLARQIAQIRMTGKYGSQVLKNILGLKARPPYEDLIEQGFRSELAAAQNTFTTLQRENPLSFLLQAEIPWWWNGILVSESSQGTVRSPFLDNDLIALLFRAPFRTSDQGASLQHALINQYNPRLMDVPTTGTHGGNYPAPIAMLVKHGIRMLGSVDKMFIRERVPHSATNWLGRLDWALSRTHVDRLFLGFASRRRYRAWFRDELAGFIRETLLSERTLCRPYWDRAYLKNVVAHHTAGRGVYLREIRKVLQVEMLHRVLSERTW